MREDNYIVEKISDQFWQSAHVLKTIVLDASLDLTLFFVCVYKDEIFTDLNMASRHEQLNEIKKNIQNNSFYSRIYEVYAPLIDNIPPNQLDQLFYHITNISHYDLNLYFHKVFEKILQKIFSYKGKYSGESIQPKEISRLIIKLAKLPTNAKVYNPFAGLASFGIFLEGFHEYYGQEINQQTWAIGKMRLKAHNKDFSYRYELSDSIEKWDEFKKYDLIVATPPFGMRIPKYIDSYFFGKSYGTIENFLIDKGLNSLKNNGKLITVFSLSFLFKGGQSTRIKKWLIDKNFIDTIITLPSGLFSNTNIPVCIIIFKTVSSRPGYVKLLDASNFYSKDGPRNKILNNQQIIDLLNDDLENDYLKYISTEHFYKNDFDLSFGRYFLKDINGTPLKEFAEIINGSKAPQGKKMRQVQIKNLKDEVFDSKLNSTEINLSVINRGTFKIIEKSCILIATKWNSLKPTYFEYTGEPIAISRSIVALRLNEDIVDPTFFINELSADYIKKQLKAYRVGSVQPILRSKDLINIIFQLPTMQEQKAKVSAIIELSDRLKKIEAEKENIVRGIQKEETESSTSLSHILGKPLLSIGSSIEIIQNALTKVDPNWKNIVISERRQFKMSDAFDSISKNLKYIQELADVNTALVSVSAFNLTEIHFLKFLSEFVKTEKKSLNGNIDLKLDIHDDIKEQMNNQILIKGNEQKLKIVLTNLIDNAKNHAFINKDQEHKINIEILPFTGNEKEADQFNYDIDGRKSYVEVKVSNTGKPFPKDLKLEDYIRKSFAVGATKNKGLGGYEVNEILKVHNDRKQALNIISNQELEYCTTISFLLPII
ncbi:Histidine kinase domain-containing protein [Tenacibaculum sp. 190524A02b]